MKLSLRFEILLKEQRCLPENDGLNDGELLKQIVDRYNSYRANTAIKRWQLSGDQLQAISNIVTGMCQDARDLIRVHLDFEKWEESGYLAWWCHVLV